jgi:ABC-type transport system involved in cytochrome c biogenesis permease subunit
MSSCVLMFAAALLSAAPPAEASLPASLDLETIRALVVQHDGRWPPLDTAARDIVETVTGDAFYNGHDPVVWLLAWTFDLRTWAAAPLIGIHNAEVRAELELPPDRRVFSYQELIGHQKLRSLIDALAERPPGSKPDPLESKVAEIRDKLLLLQRVFRGETIKPIPNPDRAGGAWSAIPPPGMDGSPASPDAVPTAWAELRTAFLADDAVAFQTASRQLIQALAALPAAHRPVPRLIATELHYNKFDPFRKAWILMVVGTVLAACALLIERKRFDGLVLLVLTAGFALVTYGLGLRWQIAGRVPASNMYESLLFLGWGTGAFAILSMFVIRHRMVPLTASAMGALALMLADVLPMNHHIRPIMPVLLDTIWMSIHVPIIMVSYSVFALAVLVAHVQLVLMAAAPGRRRLAASIDSVHYWYLHVGAILLTAGIITGSIWAASSWGRYWGWDPKEVWSLIALLGYLAILHVRLDHQRIPWWGYVLGTLLAILLLVIVVPRLAPITGVKILALVGTVLAMAFFVVARGRFATAVKSIVAFWLIVMTYLGVNYVLGIGLHSYGFGTGAMARYMLWAGGIDLALVVLCGVTYVLRRQLRFAELPA